MINFFSLGHFLQWMFVGYLFPIKWILFFVISIGWEFIELYLPFEFAIETINNKLADVIINCFGFYCGKIIKAYK